MIRANLRKLALKYGLIIPPHADGDELVSIRILPQVKAPVVLVQPEAGKVLKSMHFSLLPRWSKTRRVRFATHNARLESASDSPGNSASPSSRWIFEKPTWREPFRRRHCLVPITDFYEPIYSGSHAGHMVRFFPSEDEVLSAAGIWEEWIGPDGEVIESFAILTDDPLPFVEQTGHDRCPVFLTNGALDPWLNEYSGPKVKPEEMVGFLRSNKAKPELHVENDRALKAGWEKRK